VDMPGKLQVEEAQALPIYSRPVLKKKGKSV
jgi:hypothetical protein